MFLLDFNVALGRSASPVGGSFDDAQQLLGEMRRLGIDEALVYHYLAAEGDVLLGNRLLLAELAGHPELHACWIVAPPVLGDLPAPAAWVDEAVAAGARLVTRAKVEKLMLDGNRALGVAGRLGARTPLEVRAGTVVLCAGGIGTPRILQNSGLERAGSGMLMDTTTFLGRPNPTSTVM